MLTYSDIVKKAYHATRTYPSLWLFGLFIIGGFNLNFLHFENIPLRRLTLEKQFLESVNFFLGHPGALALACLTLLVVSLAGLVLSNWSRVMLVLLGSNALRDRPLQMDEQFKKSRVTLGTVIKISLLTSTLIIVVALGLFLPYWFLYVDPELRNLLFLAGALLFLPLAFTISCINIFTTYYVVSFKKPLGQALNLGTDLFISRWVQILGLTLVLMVIYLAAFALGAGLIFVARYVFSAILVLLARFNIIPFSAIIMVLKLISNLLLWFLLAVLSVFFNQALLILFYELNGRVEDEAPAKETEAKIVPAAAHRLKI